MVVKIDSFPPSAISTELLLLQTGNLNTLLRGCSNMQLLWGFFVLLFFGYFCMGIIANSTECSAEILLGKPIKLLNY